MSVRVLEVLDYKDAPVRLTIWNEPENFKPELCIDYHNVADSHPLEALINHAGFHPNVQFVIVSLVYSDGDSHRDLEAYAKRTGFPVVSVMFILPREIRKEQREAVKGIKRRMVDKLGWKTACVALDDKSTLWHPCESITELNKLEKKESAVFRMQWSSEATLDEPAKATFEVSIALVVRKDLNMGTGKIAAQCLHAGLGACETSMHKDMTRAYMQEHRHRRAVAVKVDGLDHLLAIKQAAESEGLHTFIQVDAGLTQVPVDTPTVLAVGPAPTALVQKITKGLKLQ